MQRYDLHSIIFGITEHSDIKPTNIFEIGSLDGKSCKVLADYFKLPDNRCYVFDANPDASSQIIQSYPNMNVYNNAVSNATGSLTFNIDMDNVGASSLLNSSDSNRKIKKIMVDSIRMDDFITSEQITSVDICKLDCEGATLEVLKSFGQNITKLQSIQIEAEHVSMWNNQILYPEIKEWLEKNGFVQIIFTLLRGKQSDSFWLKKDRMLL